jgi:hypothetical protein
MKPFYPGDKVFAEMLEHNGIPMDIHSVKAFLAGFVMGPEYVPASLAADEILLMGTEKEVVFKEASDREFFMAALEGLWAEISEFRLASVRRIRPLPETFTDFAVLFAYLDCLCEDASLFLAALEEAGLGLEDQTWSESRLEEALEELDAFLAQTEDFLEAQKRKRIRGRSDFPKLVRELCVFHDVWENAFIEICALLKSLRAEGRDLMQGAASLPSLIAKGASPQSTCPCGSGKSFRECCMLKLVN